MMGRQKKNYLKVLENFLGREFWPWVGRDTGNDQGCRDIHSEVHQFSGFHIYC